MKWIIKIMLPALLLASCSKEGTSPEGNAPEVPEERQEQAESYQNKRITLPAIGVYSLDVRR